MKQKNKKTSKTKRRTTAHLEQSDGDGERDAGGAKGSLALRHRPRVPLQLRQQVSQRHVTLVDRLQEPAAPHPQTAR